MKTFKALAGALLVAGSIAAGVTYATTQGAPARGLTVGDCPGAHTTDWFNKSSHWGNGAGKIGPGSTVSLCGAVDGPLVFRRSGTPSKPITLLFQPGATLSAPICPTIGGCLDLSDVSYVVVDGGTDGVVQDTANGTDFSDSTDSTGVYLRNCDHCVVKNLTIANIYVRSSPTDDHVGADNALVLYDGNYDTVDNVTIHDAYWGIYLRYDVSGQGRNLTIRNSNIYNSDHGVALTFNFSGGSSGPFFMYRNHLHDFGNWDSPDDTYHHDGLHCFTSTTGGAPAHINGLYWYDNLTDGTYGKNMTSPVFIEGGSGTPCADPSSNLYFFNNVSIADVGVNNGVLGLFSGHDFVYNNTLIGNSTDDGVGFDSNGTSFTFQNNLVSTFGQLAVVQPSSSGSNSLDNNVYANGGGNAFVCDNNYFNFSQLSAWKGCLGSGADGQSKRARSAQVDPAGAPTAASPVRNAGANLTNLCTGDLTPLCTDFAGNSRPTDGNWDAGAFNWVQPKLRPRQLH